MANPEYPSPTRLKRADGSHRFAFVTFLMRNDSYLSGALMAGHALRKQQVRADLVCMITEEITAEARRALEIVFDHVIEVDTIYVPHKRRQERQDRPFWFTRLNALRLGGDGDLGLRYDRVVVLDADVLPLRHYEHLFSLDAPAGIINESKDHCIDALPERGGPPAPDEQGEWKWHRIYGAICPHGQPIPKAITDRPATDPGNMGINGSLFVFEPSRAELDAVKADVGRPEVARLVGDRFDWPDMQYITMRWSGHWTSIDLRFSGLCGYPRLDVLCGIHYAGFKPWYFRRAKGMARYRRFEDFQFWFREYLEMVGRAYPALEDIKRLAVLRDNARAALEA